MRVESLPVQSLRFDPENARKHADRDLTAIKNSLKRFGQQRPILVDGDGIVRAGNGTLAAAKQLGWESISVVRTKLTGADAVAYAIADNRTAELSQWDRDVLWSNLDAIQSCDPNLLQAAGFTEAEMATFAPTDGELGLPTELGVPPTERLVYPSEPTWGIPWLKLEMQATTVSLPAIIWGSRSRTAPMNGTWLFFTEDYHFTGLWASPDGPIATGAPVACEPNFSIYADTPKAQALWGIYKKRWLARHWQERGIKVIVDCYYTETVAGEFGMLGVPDGWSAFATRGGCGQTQASIQGSWNIAAKKCGGDPHLFVVYGGGPDIKRLCELRGWVFVPEQIQRNVGRI